MNVQYYEDQIVCYLSIDQEPISLPCRSVGASCASRPVVTRGSSKRFRRLGISGYSLNLIRVITRPTVAP